MPSNMKEEYLLNKYPRLKETIASTSLVLELLDDAMNNHNHDGNNSPFIDQSVTAVLDHATKGPMDHPDGSVTTSKIADLSVTAEKLADFLDLREKKILVKSPAPIGGK